MTRFLYTLLLLIFSIPSSHPSDFYRNRGRGYLPFKNATQDGILLDNKHFIPLFDTISVESKQEAFLSFRIDNKHAHPSRLYEFTGSDGKSRSRTNPPWGIILTDSKGTNCWITVSNDEKPDLISSKAETKVSINNDIASNPLAERTVSSKALPFPGESLWRIQFKNGNVKIIAGSNNLSEVMDINVGIDDISSFGFIASPGGRILVSDISLTSIVPALTPDSKIHDLRSLETHLSKTEDPIEGYWEIFDRTLEESLLKLGGDYKLAIVKNEGLYEIIYLGGANVYASFWEPGMIKGYLRPSSFPGLFNLEWIDAQGGTLSHSITAQLEKGEVLTLQFPYHSSSVRLRRVLPAT